MKIALRALARWSLLASLAACATTRGSEQARATARIHYDIGVASLNRGDLRGALRELLVTVDQDPELAAAHNALGLVYHALEHKDDALTHYREAVELKPGFSEAHNNLGILLIDLGRYEEATRAFKQALGDILYPTPWIAEGNLGWAYYKSGDRSTADKHLRNAVAQNPKFCRGYEWLARMAMDGDDGAGMVASLSRFERHCVADKDLAQKIPTEYVREMRYYLALGHLKTGDQGAARSVLAQCATADEGAEGFGVRCRESLAALN